MDRFMLIAMLQCSLHFRPEGSTVACKAQGCSRFVVSQLGIKFKHFLLERPCCKTQETGICVSATVRKICFPLAFSLLPVEAPPRS